MVLSLQIKKKPSKSGKPLSMGFGFVEFDSMESAKLVCQNLQVSCYDFSVLARSWIDLKPPPS